MTLINANPSPITCAIADTETTGLLATDQICSVSWLGLSDLPDLAIKQTYDELFDISGAMPFAAQKIHKITKKALEGKPRFSSISQIGLPESVKYIIFHNAAYDWDKMLKKPLPVKVICTMKLAKALLPIEEGCSMSPSGKFRSYKLVDLLSDLYPDQRDFIFSGAHGSLFDTKLTFLLVRYFVENWELDSWDDLWELQNKGTK